jgi:hypothetical protein
MRAVIRVAWLPLLFACWAAHDQPSNLKDLYEHQQWFQLRQAVLAAKDPALFYKAVVAIAFHDDDAGETMLQELIRSMPGSWEAHEAARLDGDWWLRSGHQSNQSVAKPSACRLRYRMKRGCLYIPLVINGRKVEYLFDTGAGTSFVTESEARRLGLDLEPVQLQLFDAGTGRNVRIRYRGIARRLVAGEWEIRNTIFLIFPDDTFFISGFSARESGVIGMPAIQAFETVRWDADGNFDIGSPSPPAGTVQPNLAFEGDHMVVDVGFQGHRLMFGLDTGAVNTGLFPGFRKQFAELVDASGRKEKRSGGGISGTIEYDAIILPQVKLVVGGFEALLRPAEIALKYDLGDSHHGNFGLDLMNQARVVTIDFRRMRLTLEGRRADP